MHWVYSKSRDTIPLNIYNTMYIVKHSLQLYTLYLQLCLNIYILYSVQYCIMYNKYRTFSKQTDISKYARTYSTV